MDIDSVSVGLQNVARCNKHACPKDGQFCHVEAASGDFACHTFEGGAQNCITADGGSAQL